EPDALAGLVLGSGAAEQIEDALMILRIDAAAVVNDLENRVAEFYAPADQDVAGDAGLEIFQRVVDQVRKDLFQRQAIADEIGQRLDVNVGSGFGRLVRHGRNDTIDQLPGVDPLRLEFPPPFARQAEDGGYQPVHLGDRGFDEAERFAKIFRQLFVGALEHGFGAIGRIVG